MSTRSRWDLDCLDKVHIPVVAAIAFPSIAMMIGRRMRSANFSTGLDRTSVSALFAHCRSGIVGTVGKVKDG